jgi:hypothetical protein
MYIQHNKSVNKKTGKEYKSVILCSKYREGGKVKTRAIANLSHLPAHVILSIENTLKSEREATMFAYAIIKEMENKLFPFLKEYNKANSTKLAFHDITDELNKIKMCELSIGKQITSVKYPKLSQLQKQILELLNVKP